MKRQVVSLNNRTFDPLSWWAPLYIQMNTLRSKIFRQAECWDEALPPKLDRQWSKAINCLKSLDRIPNPRCKIPQVNSKSNCIYELQVFADSSKGVAAAAVYVRVMDKKQIDVHLIAAKTSLHSKSELSQNFMPRRDHCLGTWSTPLQKVHGCCIFIYRQLQAVV